GPGPAHRLPDVSAPRRGPGAPGHLGAGELRQGGAGPVKITGIETFVVDAGWRPWQFVAVRTDAGLTGYGECSDGRNPYAIVGAVRDFEPILLGQDPRPVEMRYWDLYRMARQSPGGIAAKAIAGIELALWDVKAKALGVPVYE